MQHNFRFGMDSGPNARDGLGEAMTDPTNKERGNRVITLLDAYTEIVEPGEEGEDYVITDMIADLLHLAHLQGHDAKMISCNALMHFETEIFQSQHHEES